MLKNEKQAQNDASRSFNNLIEIQLKSKQKGPHIPLEPYETIKEVWADVKFNRRKNYYSKDAPNVEYDLTFIIHYDDEIEEDMQIIYEDKPYRILAVYPTDNEKLTTSIDAKRVKRAI